MILPLLLPRRLVHACRIELWGRRLDEALPEPPPLPAGLEVAVVSDRDPPASARRRALASAMSPTASAAEVDSRLSAGRRAYVVQGPAGLLAYGWVTLGEEEQIAEVEGRIRMAPGEAYIWDCATLPPFRGRGLYPALLAAIARALAAAGCSSAFIAARADNRPSIRGFEKAGFERLAHVRYLRLWRWRRLTTRLQPAAAPLAARGAQRIVA